MSGDDRGLVLGLILVAVAVGAGIGTKLSHRVAEWPASPRGAGDASPRSSTTPDLDAERSEATAARIELGPGATISGTVTGTPGGGLTITGAAGEPEHVPDGSVTIKGGEPGGNVQGGGITFSTGFEDPCRVWLRARGWDGTPCVRCGQTAPRWDSSCVEVVRDDGSVVFRGCRSCLLEVLAAVAPVGTR